MLSTIKDLFLRSILCSRLCARLAQWQQISLTC